MGDLARNLTEEKLEKAFEQHGRVSKGCCCRCWRGVVLVRVC